jgi:hypothetical protein
MAPGLALTLVRLYLYGGLYAAMHGVAEMSVEGVQVFLGLGISLGLTLILISVHELTHGLTASLYGARPLYGAGLMHRVVPYLYCTVERHRFTRTQYAAVALAPALLVSGVGAVWVGFLPLGGWLVAPIAVDLGGCVADLWVTVLVYRQPQGTLVENLKRGVRMRDPA